LMLAFGPDWGTSFGEPYRCKMLRRRVDTIEATRIAWSSVGRRLYLVQGAPPLLRRPARSLSGCPSFKSARRNGSCIT
jgi:hypothetical protein